MKNKVNLIDAKKNNRLSDKHIQMASKLGMNLKKLGKIANHKQELWKAPLPDFIGDLHLKNFKKSYLDSIEIV